MDTWSFSAMHPAGHAAEPSRGLSRSFRSQARFRRIDAIRNLPRRHAAAIEAQGYSKFLQLGSSIIVLKSVVYPARIV